MAAALILFAYAAPAGAFAYTATSTSFFVRHNLHSISGGTSTEPISTSTSFTGFGAGGQAVVGTTSSSTTYRLLYGFTQSLYRSPKPTYTQLHYHWRNDDASESAATSGTLGTQDTATSSVPKNAAKRLRIGVSNEGGTQAAYAAVQLRVEYAPKVTTCAAATGWTDVGTGGSGDWDMADSSNLTNGADTTNIAVGSGGVTDENTYFVGSGAVLDTISQSSAVSISSHSFIEVEYSLQALSAATDSGTYCFRVTNAGSSAQFSYSQYPEATLAAGAGVRPTASAVTIDSGATSVTLTENTTKNVVCAGTVTDTDGFADITAVGAFLYRTGVGTSTASDENNLYRLYGDSQCAPSGGSGSSETYTCTFPVYYYADPTDAGSPNSADNWTCEMHPRDSVATGTPALDTVEMASLIALDTTASIGYGTVGATQDTGSTNQTTTITNTGNRDMDPQLSGTVMTSGGDTIAVSQQKYADAAFTYSSGGAALSGTPTQINITLPQRTTTVVTDDVFWGLGVPGGTPLGSYTGTNTITAAAGI